MKTKIIFFIAFLFCSANIFAFSDQCKNSIKAQNYLRTGDFDSKSPAEKVYNFEKIRSDLKDELIKSEKIDEEKVTCLNDLFSQGIKDASTYWAERAQRENCTKDDKIPTNRPDDCSEATWKEFKKSRKYIKNMQEHLRMDLRPLANAKNKVAVEKQETKIDCLTQSTSKTPVQTLITSAEDARKNLCCGRADDKEGAVKAVYPEINYNQCLSKISDTNDEMLSAKGLAMCSANIVSDAVKTVWQSIKSLFTLSGEIVGIMSALKELVTNDEAREQFVNNLKKSVHDFLNSRGVTFSQCLNKYEQSMYICEVTGSVIGSLVDIGAIGKVLKALKLGRAAAEIGSLLSKSQKGQAVLSAIKKAETFTMSTAGKLKTTAKAVAEEVIQRLAKDAKAFTLAADLMMNEISFDLQLAKELKKNAKVIIGQVKAQAKSQLTALSNKISGSAGAVASESDHVNVSLGNTVSVPRSSGGFSEGKIIGKVKENGIEKFVVQIDTPQGLATKKLTQDKLQEAYNTVNNIAEKAPPPVKVVAAGTTANVASVAKAPIAPAVSQPLAVSQPASQVTTSKIVMIDGKPHEMIKTPLPKPKVQGVNEAYTLSYRPIESAEISPAIRNFNIDEKVRVPRSNGTISEGKILSKTTDASGMEKYRVEMNTPQGIAYKTVKKDELIAANTTEKMAVSNEAKKISEVVPPSQVTTSKIVMIDGKPHEMIKTPLPKPKFEGAKEAYTLSYKPIESAEISSAFTRGEKIRVPRSNGGYSDGKILSKLTDANGVEKYKVEFKTPQGIGYKTISKEELIAANKTTEQALQKVSPSVEKMAETPRPPVLTQNGKPINQQAFADEINRRSNLLPENGSTIANETVTTKTAIPQAEKYSANNLQFTNDGWPIDKKKFAQELDNRSAIKKVEQVSSPEVVPEKITLSQSTQAAPPKVEAPKIEAPKVAADIKPVTTQTKGALSAPAPKTPAKIAEEAAQEVKKLQFDSIQEVSYVNRNYALRSQRQFDSQSELLGISANNAEKMSYAVQKTKAEVKALFGKIFPDGNAPDVQSVLRPLAFDVGSSGYIYGNDVSRLKTFLAKIEELNKTGKINQLGLTNNEIETLNYLTARTPAYVQFADKKAVNAIKKLELTPDPKLVAQAKAPPSPLVKSADEIAAIQQDSAVLKVRNLNQSAGYEKALSAKQIETQSYSLAIGDVNRANAMNFSVARTRSEVEGLFKKVFPEGNGPNAQSLRRMLAFAPESGYIPGGEFADARKFVSEIEKRGGTQYLKGLGLSNSEIDTLNYLTARVPAYAQYADKKAVSAIGQLERKIDPALLQETKAATPARWSKGSSQDALKNAERHFQKHGADFPDVKSTEEYIQKAHNFVTNPPPKILTKISRDGDKIFYDPISETFAVQDKNGAMKTIYKANPKIHGYKNNLEYFNAQ